MPNLARLFDPAGIKPEDYRSRYPELKRIPEFVELSATALMFVWYYANPTSELTGIKDDFLKVKEALEKSNFNPGKVGREDLLKLHFPDAIAGAIERMSRMNEDARFRAKKMVEGILGSYETILKNKPEDYKDKDGNIDNKKYVDTSAKIIEELPNLIKRLEEGFGISTRTEDEDENYSGVSIRDYHRSKEQK